MDSNIKAAPILGSPNQPDTLAASVDNSANVDNPDRIEGFVLGAPVVYSGVSHHPIVEGIAERHGYITKVLDDVNGEAMVSVFTNDPTQPLHVAQAKYSREVGMHGTFRLASDEPIPLGQDAATVDAEPQSQKDAKKDKDAADDKDASKSSKRGSSNTGNGG